MKQVIDAHIHLDMYTNTQQRQLLQELDEYHIEGLVAVSNHLSSAKQTWQLAKVDKRIQPAFGYHPEQQLPTAEELYELVGFMEQHHTDMKAVGEVGLPYYMRKEDPTISIEPYKQLLETMIIHAGNWNKPVVLHAIYEDAPIVCELLEKHSIRQAHFHWFKGDKSTVRRIVGNGYMLSVTPDCLYESEIQRLIRQIPLTSLMVETDGPWPFEGPFHGLMTHPKMIHASVAKIAELKRLPVEAVYHQLVANTKDFYQL
ncbi:TatD family deoxyribonuclease [Sediminibacillus dalangtanensis]|uniref:TatD family deoxyribonuclease n=2 Tax=Sediminibacillus dalangtanensis TaxID=2729421 RepID=A0ABX7VYW2_9BACI|nr:TatD family deoxyribonuclease [Sediminibacillus dalangtanensis]